MGGKEYGLAFGLGVIAKVFAEKTAVTGIQAKGEVIEDEKVGILGKNEAQGNLGALSV